MSSTEGSSVGARAGTTFSALVHCVGMPRRRRSRAASMIKPVSARESEAVSSHTGQWIAPESSGHSQTNLVAHSRHSISGETAGSG